MSTTHPSVYYSRSPAVHLDDSAGRKKNPRSIGGAHVAAVGLWVAVAFGPTAIQAIELPEAAAVSDGDLLKIELVAPKEPARAPGSTLTVGEVVDGFSRQALANARQPQLVFDPYIPADWSYAEFEAIDASPPRRVHAVASVVESEPQAVEPRVVRLNGEDRGFGFGERLPDFAAERRARRDAIEGASGSRAPAAAERRAAQPTVVVVASEAPVAAEDDQG